MIQLAHFYSVKPITEIVMKTRNEKMNISILGLAVQCALMTAVTLPLNAVADDD
jgi:hypothetical protein